MHSPTSVSVIAKRRSSCAYGRMRSRCRHSAPSSAATRAMSRRSSMVWRANPCFHASLPQKTNASAVSPSPKRAERSAIDWRGRCAPMQRKYSRDFLRKNAQNFCDCSNASSTINNRSAKPRTCTMSRTRCPRQRSRQQCHLDKEENGSDQKRDPPREDPENLKEEHDDSRHRNE